MRATITVSFLVLTVLVSIVSGKKISDPAVSLGYCVKTCDATCGLVMEMPGVKEATSCQAKCELCRDACKAATGDTAYQCGFWCIPTDNRMLESKEAEKTRCQASSVPEHRTRFQ